MQGFILCNYPHGARLHMHSHEVTFTFSLLLKFRQNNTEKGQCQSAVTNETYT